MNDTAASRPPVHFWIIAVLALLWNAVGAFDYLATQLQLESYMAGFSDEQLAYFNNFPKWAVACWAIAVWSAVFGALALLIRQRWAFHLFVISLIAMLITSFYNFVLSDGAEIMGAFGVIFSAVIVAIGIFLVFYARAMARRGVLR